MTLLLKTDDIPGMSKQLIDQYGLEWLSWHPQTILEEIGEDFAPVDEPGRNRLLAIWSLFNSDLFWTDPESFEKIVVSLNWRIPIFGLSQDVSPGEIVYAVKTVIHDVFNEQMPASFDQDVKNYMASIFADRALVYIPPEFELEGVQKYLDIGNPENGILMEAVKSKWDLISQGEIFIAEEGSTVDVQCSKLLVIKKYYEDGVKDPKKQLIENSILTEGLGNGNR